MEVYTEDAKDLVLMAINKYENDSGQILGSSTMPEFFQNFTEELNNASQVQLNSDTIYKQYYLQLKKARDKTIGFSLNYLNAFSQYLHNNDYLKSYQEAHSDDFDEIAEFPWTHPSFPATPAVRINYGDYTNLWIKDEGHNPTGVHKDRKSHEIYLMYKSIK